MRYGCLHMLAVMLVLPAAPRALADEPPMTQALEHFERRIRPVLVQHCYPCHSAEAAQQGTLQGGLQLDTRQGIRRGGDSGPAVVPGQPNQGQLMGALQHDSFEMPPEVRLPQQVIDDFESWIVQGAVDPRDGSPLALQPKLDMEEARRFWAYQPVTKPSPPSVLASDWPLTDLDRFIQAGLQSQDLQPVGDAEPRPLLRRLYFDLIGLPPTPEQSRDFVAAVRRDRLQAIRDAVDALLASPHFGERWGRHWLDVVRFAESNGRDINIVWHDAWRYRDWVIRSFNADKPFDVFVREQIAGDLLPASSRQQRDDQIIATAALAMAPKTVTEPNAEIFQMDLVDDQIEVITRSFLGLSVSCARCHDHKFDPIPTKDYYALAGILKSTETLYGYARVGAPTSPHADLEAIGPDAERLAASGRAYRQQIIDRNDEFQSRRRDRYGVVKKVQVLKNQLARAAEADSGELQAQIDELEAEIQQWDQRLERMEMELAEFQKSPPPLPNWTMALRDHAEPTDCHIHIRGETTNLGEHVPRGLLQSISVPGITSINDQQSGRLQLADWLASRHNPLTPRVAVNRVWSHLFGRGIVSTIDDFGMTGSPPSHPQLLDYLAAQFVEQGWSTKRLIREIVLSRTYQLASSVEPEQQGIDPDNQFFWRFRPRRLEVEAFRDAVMAVSGELDRCPPSKPFLSQWNPYEHTQITIARPFVTPEQITSVHRTVYLPVLRSALPKIFDLFDFADPNRVVGERNASTLPAQALFLMNSHWITERCRHAAQRLLADPRLDESDRVGLLYERALGRLPTAAERDRALRYVSRMEDLKVDPDLDSPSAHAEEERWTSLCQTLFCSGDFWYLQ